jgi:hypothetical protein
LILKFMLTTSLKQYLLVNCSLKPNNFQYLAIFKDETECLHFETLS